MSLSTLWNRTRIGTARAFQNAVVTFCKLTDGTFYRPLSKDFSGTGEQIEGYQEILQGGWEIQSDEAFPETVAQVRTHLERMLTSMDPEMAQRLGMFYPDNLELLGDVWAMPGWKIPELKDKRAILDLVNELLLQAPIEAIDPMTGAPAQQPSIELNTFLFDPHFTSRIVREWALSDAGKRAKAENPMGYYNVILFGQSAQVAANPPPMLEDGTPMEPGMAPEAQPESGPVPVAEEVPIDSGVPEVTELPLQ